MRNKLVAMVVAVVLVVLAGLLVRAVGGEGGQQPTPDQGSDSAPAGEPAPPDTSAFELAVSQPREDSVYPNVGDPGVDALHYDLDLDWDPEQRTLEGIARITFRATATDAEFRLDLGEPLEVRRATLDGVAVDWEHNGKDLVVRAEVEEGRDYLLGVTYTGSPEPTKAPTTRADFDTIGWTTTDDGEVWTMQEPYGAFTWYPVNDQPSDKAFYDFEISVPPPWVGVANGVLLARSQAAGVTTTEWRLDAPAASYLVTIGIGDLVLTRDRSESGVPISYWTPRGDDAILERVRFAPEGLAWAEDRLGPYPYESLGVLVVDSRSGMETQTMITLGATDYATSPEVLVHEIVHQWYGNLVTPTDWRDIWMNEGLTMYLQGQFEADRAGIDVARVMDRWAPFEASARVQSGPPGAYDPNSFAEGNVYYGPALMWHEVREQIGDRRFWSMVRAWPSVRAHGNATRKQYLAWVEEETGAELTALFDAWLLGRRTPAR